MLLKTSLNTSSLYFPLRYRATSLCVWSGVRAHDLDYFRDDTALFTFTPLRENFSKSNHRCDLMEE